MLITPPWRKLVVVAGLATAIGLAGCSSAPSSSGGVASINGSGATSTSAASGSGSGSAQGDAAQQDAMVKFAQCMRAHGVNMPDPTPGGAGGRGAVQALPGVKGNDPAAMQKMQAANTACEKLLPNGGKPTAQDIQRQLKFAQCMRAHGVEMADPNPNGVGGKAISINESDPKTKAALSACISTGPNSGK
ncbi:MAG TPA: hypothetical protein VGM75_32500 [Pseudonocardiaceae bacterium]|jgi:hypothetical protein